MNCSVLIKHPPQAGDFLFSVANFWALINKILTAQETKSLCEIGVESGTMSSRLLQFCNTNGGRYIGIDPSVSEEFSVKFVLEGGVFYRDSSLNVLADLPLCDAYIVDGDHNYNTVSQELELIRARVLASGGSGQTVVVLHDVGWPTARRDSYYLPSLLPLHWIKDYETDLGPSLHSSELRSDGLVGCSWYGWAKQDGGPKNGVLTAVEDFLGTNTDLFEGIFIPGCFGIAVLYTKYVSDKVKSEMNAIRNSLLYFSDLIQYLEFNRLDLYSQFMNQVRENQLLRDEIKAMRKTLGAV